MGREKKIGPSAVGGRGKRRPEGVLRMQKEEQERVRKENAAALRKAKRAKPVGVTGQEFAAMVREELERRRSEWPSRFVVPNVAQARLFAALEKTPFPKDLVFLGGNGTGKTYCGLGIVAGITWGPRAVVGDGVAGNGWAGMQHYEGWHIFREIAKREKRMIYGRIVAVADNLKGNGAVIQRIRRLFPKGLWEGRKLGKNYVSEIWCWDNQDDFGIDEKAISVIEIKTHDQDPDQHRGPDCDWILFDEPCTPDVYEESVGRTRANEHAVMIHTLTPLELAGWLIDQLVEPAERGETSGNTLVVRGSLWDNCQDWHPDPTMWSGGKVDCGVPLNRGNLKRRAIENQIDKWQRMSPDTVAARVWGKPTHLSGAVYKNWNREVHMVDEIPGDWSDWPIWNIIDPHHARAPMVLWVAQGPHTSYIIAEWPDEDYSKYRVSDEISGYARTIMTLEKNVSRQVLHRWGDPNSLKNVYSSSKGYDGMPISLQALYANEGLYFMCANDKIDVGHNCVNEMLSYDKLRPLDPLNNFPKLQCLKRNLFTGAPMVNVPTAMERYGFKKKALEQNKQPNTLRAIMDETYKDTADVIRYFCVSVRDVPFQTVSSQDTAYDWMSNRDSVSRPLVIRRR